MSPRQKWSEADGRNSGALVSNYARPTLKRVPDGRLGQKGGCVRKEVLDRGRIRDGITEFDVLLDDVEHAARSRNGLRIFTVQRWGRTPQATVYN